MRGVALVVAVLALASVLGLAWRARNGRFRATPPSTPPVPAVDRSAADATSAASTSTASTLTDARATVETLTAADLGVALGARATFVQLSSEVCSACRATRTVLEGVAAAEPGVVHVELDVAEHLDLVRRFGVMRTPTTLVLAHDGTLTGRMSGGTDRRQALTALASCPAPESCRDVVVAR